MRLGPSGFLGSLQARVPAGNLRQLSALDSRSGSYSTLLHLESQIESARILKSQSEYRTWVLAYARVLAAAGEEGRLRGLCAELFGTPSVRGDHELLRAVLTEAATAQRVVTEYMQMMEDSSATAAVHMLE